jgi:hypothetical protein
MTDNVSIHRNHKPQIFNREESPKERLQIPVNPGEEKVVPPEILGTEMMPILNALAEHLAEEDMLSSMLNNVNDISRPNYEMIKNDFREEHKKTRDCQRKISQFIMANYHADVGDLSWRFESTNMTLIAFTKVIPQN